ncbi:hypothetical protein AVEN_21949-1 [Araneus ventricosus]|uniref:Uncharacterized protein n=1 Tax=Araneus ventricosus TaxID=182803 RepID=A0A4Y2UZN0_ARAVE|nr:hypothetical protein AVEN_21949-1 [Araneus ventricosus]
MIRDEAFHFIEAQVETPNCRPMNVIYQFYKSKNFAALLMANSPVAKEVNATVHRNRMEAETPAQSRRERDAAAHSRPMEGQTPDQSQARR